MVSMRENISLRKEEVEDNIYKIPCYVSMVMDERLFVVTTQEVRDVQWLMNVDLE